MTDFLVPFALGSPSTPSIVASVTSPYLPRLCSLWVVITRGVVFDTSTIGFLIVFDPNVIPATPRYKGSFEFTKILFSIVVSLPPLNKTPVETSSNIFPYIID